MSFVVSSFYKISRCDEEQIAAHQQNLEHAAARLGLSGLVILAGEGVNGTVCGEANAVYEFQRILQEHFSLVPSEFKHSPAAEHVFGKFTVKVRREVVTSASGVELGDSIRHLSPSEWDRIIDEEQPILIDTRNDYEMKVGKFRNAIDLGLEQFSEFPAKMAEQSIPKDQKILIYCTGGIRCEKAIHELAELGWENVFQLNGGILNYLHERPESGNFEGECFVFDERVAVDSSLNPSTRYAFCRLCGDPTETRKSCEICEAEIPVCAECGTVCSKNCLEQQRRRALKSARAA